MTNASRSAKEGEGVIDVVADEARGLIYAITCEHQHWMLLDTKHPEKELPRPGADPPRPAQHLDRQAGPGHGHHQGLPGGPLRPSHRQGDGGPPVGGRQTVPYRRRAGRGSPRLEAGGRWWTAYLQLLNDLRLFQVDLGSAAGKPVLARSLG